MESARVRSAFETTDEDSAFVSPVSSFASFLKGTKKHPGQVIVAGVYGKPTTVEVETDPRYGFEGGVRLKPTCESAHGSATPGIRINRLLSQFPARAAQSSICEPDLSWAMRNTALLAKSVATRTHCLSGPIENVSSCRVDSITGRGTAQELATTVPPCEGKGSGSECFVIEADPETCGETESGLRFEIKNSVRSSRGQPNGDTLTVTCETSVATPLR